MNFWDSFSIYDLLSNKNLLLKHYHLDLNDSSLVCSILIPDRSLKISRMGVSHKISTVTCYQCDDGYKCDISLKTMWQYYETSRGYCFAVITWHLANKKFSFNSSEFIINEMKPYSRMSHGSWHRLYNKNVLLENFIKKICALNCMYF